MKYRNLGKCGLKVSEVGLGCMRLNDYSQYKEKAQVIHAALDQGINFFDTADSYRDSEKILGRAIKESNKARHEVVISTKIWASRSKDPNDRGCSRQHILKQVHENLRGLQTDYIDIYIMHHFDPYTPLEETLSTLDDLVHQGKVRYIGASHHFAWQLCKALWVSDVNGFEKYSIVHPLYNMFIRDIERDLIPLCKQEGLAVVPWRALAGGILTGKMTREQLENPQGAQKARDLSRLRTEKTLAVIDRLDEFARGYGKRVMHLAVAWLVSQPKVTVVPLIGSRNLEQFFGLAEGFGWHLKAEELETIEKMIPPGPVDHPEPASFYKLREPGERKFYS